LLEVSIRKRLREFDLDLSFTVQPKETLVIIGPSGAGKTTILAQISGLLSPDEGHIAVGDRVLYDSSQHINVPPERRHLGYVLQDYALFPHLTVRQNVGYGMSARRLPADTIQRGADEVMAMLGISAMADLKPSRISGGERQRVALARAIAVGGEVLLLDEPLAALDAQTRQSARGDLRRIIHSVGAAAVFVTHDYVDALAFGDTICVMDRGHVVQMGTQQDLLLRPKARFVAEFMGVNFLEGIAEAADHTGTSLVRVADIALRTVAQEPGEVFLAFSPADVTLSPEPPSSSALNVLEGRVTAILQLGGRMRVDLDAGIPLVAELTPESVARLNLGIGSKTYASFKATAIETYR